MSANNFDDDATQYGSAKHQSKYDDEATQYDSGIKNSNDEKTSYDDSNNKKSEEEDLQPFGKKKKNVGKVAAVVGGGVLLGGATALFTSFAPHPGGNDEQSPDWVDGKVPVAHDTNDDMSFDEAFTTARAEVGPGGVFQWHGYIYSTYTDDEWNNLSDSERAEYGSHFNWTGDTPDSDSVEVVSHEGGTVDEGNHGTEQHSEGPDYMHEDPSKETAEVNEHDVHVEQQPQPQPQPTTDDSDVEILGVTHDDESNMNIAGVKIDGEDAILVDVDNDNEFEVFAQDANHDGHLQENEMVDISGQHITTDQLGGLSDTPDDNVVADTTVDTDYSTDTADGVDA